VEGWLLVIAIVTMIAAIAAAYFGYPGWKASRAKPDLRLMVEAGPATSARFHIKLQNDGNGSATDWKLTITMPRGSRFSPVGWNFPGWSDREARNGWIATWMAQGSDDSIGPGLHRDILMEPAGGEPQTIRATYSLKANGMAERTGGIEVEIGERPDRPQETRVTSRAIESGAAAPLRLPNRTHVRYRGTPGLRL
jgi:hypothetical protein